jgi:hypothetical protein
MSWKEYAKHNVNTFLDYITKTDFTILEKVIEYESNLYKNN